MPERGKARSAAAIRPLDFDRFSEWMNAGCDTLPAYGGDRLDAFNIVRGVASSNGCVDPRAFGMRSEYLTFLRFLGVGGLNTAFGYFSYAAFVLAGAPIGLAVIGSTALAFFFNFASYGRLVFGSTSYRLLPRFLAFYACLGGLNYSLLRALVWGGLGPLWAQASLLPLLAGVGFVGMRHFVFRSGPPDQPVRLKAGDGEI